MRLALSALLTVPSLLAAPRPPRHLRRQEEATLATSGWACLEPGDFSCPGVDELPRDAGCQVACRGTEGCSRARQKCAMLPSCTHHTTNSENTWATLKVATPRKVTSVSGKADIWCPPAMRPRARDRCTEKEPLCVIIARQSDYDLFTARLEVDVPRTTPVVLGLRAFYPPARHAAAAHLAFVYNAYAYLPKAVAFVVDYGDLHATSGCNVCAQAMQLRAITEASPGLLTNPRCAPPTTSALRTPPTPPTPRAL